MQTRATLYEASGQCGRVAIIQIVVHENFLQYVGRDDQIETLGTEAYRAADSLLRSENAKKARQQIEGEHPPCPEGPEADQEPQGDADADGSPPA